MTWHPAGAPAPAGPRFVLIGFTSQNKAGPPSAPRRARRGKQRVDYGYWKFSNGNFTASNNDCTGLTIKGPPMTTAWSG
jgi:hypothetical protein